MYIVATIAVTYRVQVMVGQNLVYQAGVLMYSTGESTVTIAVAVAVPITALAIITVLIVIGVVVFVRQRQQKKRYTEANILCHKKHRLLDFVGFLIQYCREATTSNSTNICIGW